MTAILEFLTGCWLWLLTALRLHSKPRFVVRTSETHPSAGELSETDLVIVQSGGHLKWACFICPCGCGEKIALSLAANRRPRWSVSVDRRRRPTVSPSVWQRAGCYSHFWIKNGEIDWCRWTGQLESAAELD